MKTINKILILFIVAFTTFSCIDNDTLSDENVNSPNLISFTKSEMSATIIANGDTSEHVVNLKIKGPTASEISDTVTATVEVDASSTAIEGTHYTLNSSAVSFSSDNELTSSIDWTMISAGIASPSQVKLVLNVVNSSSDSVVPSGRTGQIVISLKYLCPSALEGSYQVNVTREDGASWGQGIETITNVGPGKYKTVTTGGWTAGQYTPTQGFDFEDLCDALTVPTQGLFQNQFTNQVYQTDEQAALSMRDPNTGDLHIVYTITFSDGAVQLEYVNNYIKQ